MKKLGLLIVVLVCFSMYLNAGAELLRNPGFEEGPAWSESVDPYDWWKYGDGGWNTWKSVSGGSAYPAHTGDKLAAVGAWTSGEYQNRGQSVPVNPGEIFTFTAWARTEEWNPVSSNPIGGLYIEWKDACDITIGMELLSDITNGMESLTYTKYSLGPVTAPAFSVNANVQVYGEARGTMLFDDCSFFFTYAANDEQPEDGSFANPYTTTELSWIRPQARNGTDTIYCDVWFGTDADMPGTNTKIRTHADANFVNVSLSLGNTYYWRVDCYDPDTGGGGVDIKTEGRVWSFDTINSAPTVDAGKKQAVWLSGGTAAIELDATASDDNLPNPPGAVTYSWTKVSGAGSVVFSPASTVEDPNAAFTTAGDYILRLTVNDGAADSNDTVKIRVYNEGYTGLIAHWKLDESTGTTAVDSQGGHNGTLVGDPLWQPSGGQVAGDILLDGNGDYIDCGGATVDHNSPTWADLTEEITIAVWIKLDAFDPGKPWQAIVTKGDAAWRISRAGNENVINFACNGPTPNFDVQGFTDVTDGQWHQIVGTYDGAEIALYVDGILDIYSGSPLPAEGSIAFDNNDVYIGANQEKANREFDGDIDEVRIYEIGLPLDRVVDLFRADGGQNSCPENLPGDVNGDCYVNMTDFAGMALNWLKCNDVGNALCD